MTLIELSNITENFEPVSNETPRTFITCSCSKPFICKASLKISLNNVSLILNSSEFIDPL